MHFKPFKEMKKALLELSIKKYIISLLIGMSLLALPFLSFAQEENDPESEGGILNHLHQLTELSNYKTRSNLNGAVTLTGENGNLDVQYRINLTESNIKESLFEGRGYGQVQVFLQMDGSTSTSLDEMTVMARAEMISEDRDMYLKMKELSIKGSGYSQEVQQKVDQWLQHYEENKDQWLAISPESFKEAQTENTEEDPLNAQALLENVFMQEGDRKENFINAFDGLLSQTSQDSIYYTEKENLLEAMGLMINSDLFLTNDILIGFRKGFTAFNLNKPNFLSLVEAMAVAMELPLNEEDQATMEDWTSDLILRGAYRTNETHNVVDGFVLNLKTDSLGSLKDLTTSYTHQVYDFGKAFTLQPPTSSTPIEPILGDLL